MRILKEMADIKSSEIKVLKERNPHAAHNKVTLRIQGVPPQDKKENKYVNKVGMEQTITVMLLQQTIEIEETSLLKKILTKSVKFHWKLQFRKDLKIER